MILGRQTELFCLSPCGANHIRLKDSGERVILKFENLVKKLFIILEKMGFYS